MRWKALLVSLAAGPCLVESFCRFHWHQSILLAIPAAFHDDGYHGYGPVYVLVLLLSGIILSGIFDVATIEPGVKGEAKQALKQEIKEDTLLALSVVGEGMKELGELVDEKIEAKIGPL